MLILGGFLKIIAWLAIGILIFNAIKNKDIDRLIFYVGFAIFDMLVIIAVLLYLILIK